jgi:hypothetical protein
VPPLVPWWYKPSLSMKSTRVALILAILGFFSLLAGCSDAGEEGPCSPNPCLEPGRTRCETNESGARCICDTGYVEIDGVCVSTAACTPNPCTAPYKTTCVPRETIALCVCDPGHAPAGDGCDPFPIFDCSVVHSTGAPDAFEPDECPSKATDLPIAAIWTDGHTLNPEGDVDWFRIPGTTRRIYELQATSADVDLYADVYAKDGVSPVGADHRGTKVIVVWFKATSDDSHYARIQALHGNATGAYRVRVTDIGIDDFADVPATALSIAAGASVDGELQFDGDRDVLKLPLQGGIAYAVSFEFSGVGTPFYELIAGDGVTVTQKLSGTKVETVTRSPAAGAVFLRVSGLANTLGPFRITTATLGQDDHGDIPAEATPIVPGDSPIVVSVDRTADVDVMGFEAAAPNIYAFTCTPTPTSSGFGRLLYTLTDSNGAVLAQSSTGSTAPFAQKISQSGRMFVHVRAEFVSQPGLKFSCKLQNLGVDDHGDTIAGATPITVGAGVSAGTLEMAGDKDVFSFTAVAGHVYRAQCNMPNYGSCSVRLLSSSGGELTSGSAVAWEVSTAGTYYVEVGTSYGTTSASYTFVLDDLGTDDHGDTVAAATAVTAGALPGVGAIEAPLDKDVFSFEALAQHIYRFTCTPSTNSSCALKMIGPSGAVLTQSSGYTGSPAVVAYEVIASGRYYVEVSVGYAYGSLGMSYSYTLENLGVDDHGDDVMTATPVSVGDVAAASLEFAGDVDAFTFTPTAGRVYRFECKRGTLTSCDLGLKDAIGTTLYSVSTSSDGQISFEAASANPVVFIVGESSYSMPQGTYTWSITDVGVDDHGDTFASATSASLPMTVQGAQLESFGDVDVFAFAATARRIYRTRCTQGTLSSCRIRVKDGSGNIVAEQSYWDSTVATFVASVSATYYAEISSGSSYGVLTGTYSWVIEDLGLDDHGNTPASATGIAIGSPATGGKLEFSGEVDVFSFEAVAGRIYLARCAFGTGYGCSVSIKNVTDATLATGQTQAGYETSVSETLFVEIRSDHGGDVGAYTIVVDDLGTDDHGDNSATATRIPALDNSVNGVIELYGDADYFSISLNANTQYSVTVIGNNLEVEVYSTNGSFLGNGFSPLTLTTTTAGIYYVKVSSWSYGALNIPYTVQVR